MTLKTNTGVVYLSTSDINAAYGYSREHIGRLCKRGVLPFKKSLNGLIFINETDIAEYAAAHGRTKKDV